MMGVSGPELLVILVVALLVIGPRDLPSALRAFGRMVGRLRRQLDEVRREVDALGREAIHPPAARPPGPPAAAPRPSPVSPSHPTDEGA
ncbi:twin-arginine translocase TatA/TatE family subunit [Rubrimonas sp.]|uniref:twin-arginine translocase TatA/TatE family subunit n=1 Tax=Rubrimonas sp. TaxID=2036015 RepID=UPI002FDD4D23